MRQQPVTSRAAAARAPVRARGRGLVLLAVAALAAACGTNRYFTPRENVNGTGNSGLPAAVYPLVGPDGASVGEVRVWSPGAERRDVDDASGARETTRLLLTFELESTGDLPLRLDAEAARVKRLVTVAAAGEADPAVDPGGGAGGQAGGEGAAAPAGPAPEPGLAPVLVDGDVAAPAGDVARVRLEFAPGDDVWPRSINAFDLHWVVRVGDLQFRQITPFLPYFPEPYYWDDRVHFGFGFGYYRYSCW